MCIRDSIYAVGPVDGNSTAARDEAYDLVARYRAAAFGKTDRQIMDLSLIHILLLKTTNACGTGWETVPYTL